MDEKHEMIRSSVREFAESEIRPVAGDLEEKEEFSVELTRKMGDIGLLGMVVSEEYGGQGLDYISYIIAMEEIARIDGSQAAVLAAGNSLGISPIDAFGSEAQKRKYLPDLCRGKTLMGFGLTEPNAGSDAGATRTNGCDQNKRGPGRGRLGHQRPKDTDHECKHIDDQRVYRAGSDRGKTERKAGLYLLYPGEQHTRFYPQHAEEKTYVAGVQHRGTLY